MSVIISRGRGNWSVRALVVVLVFLPLRDVAAGQGAPFVDLQLVIASDVSVSMDTEEKLLQAAGFAAAFRNPDIVQAIMSGPTGRIAVTYTEWGGARRQKTVVPWMVIDSSESAMAFADAIERWRPSTLRRGTSIAGALSHALDLIAGSDLEARRLVINLSGDGPDDGTLDLQQVRESVLENAVTINALAVVYKDLLEGVIDGSKHAMTPADLLAYFSEQVIGGPGAFVEPVVSMLDYELAIGRKLLREIAGPSLLADGGVSDPNVTQIRVRE